MCQNCTRGSTTIIVCMDKTTFTRSIERTQHTALLCGKYRKKNVTTIMLYNIIIVVYT